MTFSEEIFFQKKQSLCSLTTAMLDVHAIATALICRFFYYAKNIACRLIRISEIFYTFIFRISKYDDDLNKYRLC